MQYFNESDAVFFKKVLKNDYLVGGLKKANEKTQHISTIINLFKVGKNSHDNVN